MLTLVSLLAADKPAQLNKLTKAEKKAGWRLLFDGKTTAGWRAFNKSVFPNQGWGVENGALKHQPKGGGGDIVTVDQFTDFDFHFEWRVAPGANSGVKYFIDEKRGQPIGHEYQVIDDNAHADALRGGKWQTSALYDLFPPKDKTLRPVGEWNESRILVEGKHVEHWLNGKQVLDYELESDALKTAIAGSKFKNVAGFGTKFKTPILLQDHGDEVAYRNLKLRELSAKP
ncbi:MAG: DUF1080 domain-containing protein [Verrucomicrobia bacterium]|nr:DUF1080 domain-containing protein [Verrucomicrobiota bacterium]